MAVFFFTENQKIKLGVAHLKHIEAQTFDHLRTVFIFIFFLPVLQCFINAGVLDDKGEGWQGGEDTHT